MWSLVTTCDNESAAPSSRSKHSATLVGDHIYLLGGRNGNLPMRDFWKYNIVNGKWHQLKPSGDKLPALQEHSAVSYKDLIYVFGGEVGFSAGTETPLWVYDIKNNSWKKIKPKKGVSTPKGRRGHTALVYRGTMFIYGGYQDLKGSCSELWAFHFETESWHLLSNTPTKSNTPDGFPPPRHKHSALIHDDCMWIYGGMTDLQERSDFWKWDIRAHTWTNIRTKINPGNLNSHAACKLPSCMVLFGGEKDGNPTNDVWKFNFSTETWEKLNISGLKPQPRSESVAFAVSELLLKDGSSNSLENKASKIRARTCSSADRGNRHSSYFPSNRIAPCEEKTYVFNPSQENYTDGSELMQGENNRSSRSILQEITKLSQLNISRLNAKCSYSVLAGCPTDSTESLLKQHASPQGLEIEGEDILIATPTRGTMVKSKSAFTIKKKYSPDGEPNKRRVEFDTTVKKIPHEPISVPNFSTMTLPTPVLTPVEAAKLVYLDTDEENELENDPTLQKFEASEKENLRTVTRGESYSSHLAYADNPLYQAPKGSHENVSSTSDYASIETVNRLSSASNYSVKNNVEEKNRVGFGSFGFCNPNYMGPDIKNLLKQEEKKGLFHHAEKLLEETNNLKNSEENLLEMRNLGRDCKVFFKNNRNRSGKSRASSASRAEFRSKCRNDVNRKSERNFGDVEPFVPVYVYVVGGKEHGQVTVFQRPLSIWKLKLF